MRVRAHTDAVGQIQIITSRGGNPSTLGRGCPKLNSSGVPSLHARHHAKVFTIFWHPDNILRIFAVGAQASFLLLLWSDFTTIGQN